MNSWVLDLAMFNRFFSVVLLAKLPQLDGGRRPVSVCYGCTYASASCRFCGPIASQGYKAPVKRKAEMILIYIYIKYLHNLFYRYYICINACIDIFYYNTLFSLYISLIYLTLEKKLVTSKASPANVSPPYSRVVSAIRSLCNSSKSECWQVAFCKTAH